MTQERTREELDAAVLSWISEGVESSDDDERFQTLALELFGFQYRENPAYRRISHAFGKSPENVTAWHEIPPVPTGAFKQARLACFPQANTRVAFQTSGSTTGTRGRLELDSTAVYEASLLATFGPYICPDAPLPFAILAPSAADAPDSSLSFMFDRAAREFGKGESRFYLTNEGWSVEGVIEDLAAAREPLLVAGTAFAFVHLTDALVAARRRLELPTGTRVMETGGFKGRSRQVKREDLHAQISATLGVATSRIVNQYGMCELGSQFYEDSLRLGENSSIKRVPPWVRTRAIALDTMLDVQPGELGVLVHYDLANTGSVLAIQTSDLGRSVDTGFEVVGRLEGAEARGCSIAADALLAETST